MDLSIKIRHKNIELIRNSDVIEIETLIQSSLPDYFIDFISKYQGAQLNEFIFCSKEKIEWIIGFINQINEIKNLTNEFVIGYNKKLVPFTYDSGGWHFCLSFDKETYGKIIVNRWTDHLPEDQFLVIADSFEEFINGLKTEDEI